MRYPPHPNLAALSVAFRFRLMITYIFSITRNSLSGEGGEEKICFLKNKSRIYSSDSKYFYI